MLIHRPTNRALWAPHGVAPPDRVVNCVFLTCFDHDALFFKSILGQGGICLFHADNLSMADLILLATCGTVLMVDTNFLDGSWEDALAMTAAFHPLVATLICADYIDRPFLDGVHERGAFEVLWRPLDVLGLSSSIRRAHEATVERRLWRAAVDEINDSSSAAAPVCIPPARLAR